MCWLARARKTNVKNARTQMMRFLENLQFKNAVKKKRKKILSHNDFKSRALALDFVCAYMARRS